MLILGVFILCSVVDVLSAANSTRVCGDIYLTATHEYSYLESPGYPKQYPNNVDCIWTISSSASVQLEVLKSSLQWSYLCTKDNVTVYDGFTYNRQIRTWCGEQTPKINSSGLYLTIRFRTDEITFEQGFRLRYRNSLATCGDHLTASSQGQFLTSPGYPYFYPTNLNCTWIIKTISLNIKLQVVYSHLTPCNNMEGDYVAVYDGNKHLGTFCGYETPTYYSETTTLRVVFVTDDKYQYQGFKMRYSTTRFTGRCGPMFLTAYSYAQSFQTPNYPHTNMSNLNCSWTIMAKQSYTIKLNVIDADSVSGCNQVRVNVHDGPNQRSPVLGTFCGNLKPTYISSNNTVTISVKTNTAVGGGFKLSYHQEHFNVADLDKCGTKNLTAYGYDSYLKSPGYPDGYENYLDCKWTISSESSRNIQVGVIEADMEYGCVSDVLEFYDGYINDEALLGTVCSDEQRGSTITSSGTKMIVTFKTGGKNVNERKGFRLSYKSFRPPLTALPVEYFVQFLTSPGYPSDYPNNADLSWSLNTDYPNTINVEVKVLDIEYNFDCHLDYLQIFDDDFGEGTSLGKWCGKNIPLPIQSSGQSLFIKFHSNSDKVSSGFKLGYKSITKTNKSDYKFNIVAILPGLCGVAVVLVVGVILCAAFKVRKTILSRRSGDGSGTTGQNLRVIELDRNATNMVPPPYADAPPSYDEVVSNSLGYQSVSEAPPPYSPDLPETLSGNCTNRFSQGHDSSSRSVGEREQSAAGRGADGQDKNGDRGDVDKREKTDDERDVNVQEETNGERGVDKREQTADGEREEPAGEDVWEREQRVSSLEVDVQDTQPILQRMNSSSEC